jgi:hypothetical protein
MAGRDGRRQARNYDRRTWQQSLLSRATNGAEWRPTKAKPLLAFRWIDWNELLSVGLKYRKHQ